MAYQQVIILGNLGKDPETSNLPSGASVTNFSVAVTESWMKDGEKQEHTEWFNCQAWGKRGEVIAQYFSKGSPIFIVGSNRTRQYEKDGVKRYATDVVVNNFSFVGGKSNNPAPQNNTAAPAAADFDNSDIPF